jgi:hypothetical protein
MPLALRSQFDTVLTAVQLDLRCDETGGVVAQVLRSGRLALVAYTNGSSGFEEVLMALSPADGPEEVVFAADLNEDGHLDLVTMSQDEGGYIPRVFVSDVNRYTSARVPREYTLRQEELWSSQCHRQILPVLLEGNRLQLRRETISPDSTIGHGANCALPADTLAIVGNRLVPVH